MKKMRKIFNRKSILSVITVCLMLFFISCSRESAENVEITVIHGWGSNEDDHVAMRKIYSDFEKTHPDVKIHLVSMPTSKELFRKVGDMILVGEMPDVIFFGGSGNNEIYNYMVKNELALDLMPYIETDEEFQSHIAESNLEYWKTIDGKLYSIADTLMLSGGYWYNERIFEQAGIEKVPESWEEFFQVCSAIKTWSQEEGNDVRPLQVSTEGYLYFMDHMLADNGGKAEKAVDWNKIEIVESEFEVILEQLRKVYDYSAVKDENYSYRDETDAFNEGKLAMYINGVWGAPMIQDAVAAKYALLPTAGGYSMSCESTGLGYILGKTDDDARQQMSIEFLKYMLSDDVQARILKETEQVPASPMVQIENYKEEMPRFYQAAELVKQADKKIETPDNLWDSTRKGIFEEHILEVLRQELTTKEFMKILG